MLCLLLKALLVLHCKLALYYVQQSGAASQRSVQTCLPRALACVVTRVEALKHEGVCSSRTRRVRLGLGDILL
jgi:hypothetical protein